MKKRIIFTALLFILLPLSRIWAQFPQADISNGMIKANLYLPDAANGYYRATRFDWAGVVSSLQYKGHEFFGEWFEKHDPKKDDGITGPVEEFSPLGYENAKAGDTFIKIGVGIVKKPDMKAYSFSRAYELLNNGKWTVKKKKDRVEFTHVLTDQNGYGYIYKKTLRLVKGKPVLLLEHSIKNTGQKIIESNVYDHNMFMIDKQPSGPDFSIKFPFKLEADNLIGKDVVAYRDDQIIYQRAFNKKNEDAFTHLKGFSNDAKDYDIRIENSKTGSGVRITADQPLSSLAFWSIAATLCPEPYIAVKALPGQEFKWTISYEFLASN